MSNSKWAIVRDFVNSKEIGHIFTRSDLILFGKLTGIKSTTIDTERNNLMKAGFLKFKSRGRYELVKKTPEGMTTTELWLLSRNDTLGYLDRVYKRKLRSVKKEITSNTNITNQ